MSTSLDDHDTAPLSSRLGCVATTVVLLLSLCAMVVVGVYLAFTALTELSYPIGEDSWGHYASGGFFATKSADLSGDGERIVFASPRTGQGDIYIVDVRTGQSQMPLLSPACEKSPRFRPGHEQILFERETDGCRHIWLYDLTTEKSQQLTSGMVLDDLYDTLPSGSHALIGRSIAERAAGRLVRMQVLEIDTGKTTELPDSSYGHFSGDETTIFSSRYDSGSTKIEELRLDGSPLRLVGQGWVTSVAPTGEHLVIHDGKTQQQPDESLNVLNMKNGQRERIGQGHSSCAFANGKVLFFSGYEHQAWLWDGADNSRKIESPKGYKIVPADVTGDRAAILVVPLNGRDFQLHLFDAQMEQFQEVAIQPAPPQ